ncbi:MAG: DUF2512 family protein [Bacillota bacterium]
MGHLKTFSFKAILNIIPLFLILSLLGDMGWFASIIISIAITAVSYALDVYVLPRAGNAIAAISDGVLVFFILWVLRYIGAVPNAKAMIYSVAAVIIVEGLIYHPYLKRLVAADSMGPIIGDRE